MNGRTADERWLRRIIFLGVAVDVVVGLTLVFSPDRLFDFLGFPAEADPEIFVRYSGCLMIARALAIMQAALNPLRNPLLLAAALLIRLLAATFFAIVMLRLGTLAYWPALGIECFFFTVPLWLVIRAFHANLDRKP